MRTRKPLVIACLLLPTLLVIACQNNKPEFAEKIIGKWEITKALRNGADTPTLQGGFLEFQDAQKVLVNLDGRAQPASYKLKEKKIIIEGSSTDGEYLIQALEGSNMKLFVKIRGFDFEFDLIKVL